MAGFSGAQAIKGIRALHATYPPDKPRAAVFILAYPLHCGEVRAARFRAGARRNETVRVCLIASLPFSVGAQPCTAPMSKPGCTQLVAIKRSAAALKKTFFSK